MSGEPGPLRFDPEQLLQVLGRQAAASRPSEDVRAMLGALSGAAFCVFDADLRLVFAEGDQLDALGVDSRQPSGAILPPEFGDICRLALSGEQARVDVHCDSEILEVHAAPVRGDDATPLAAAIAVNVTTQRYAQLRMDRRTRGQAELTALSRRAAEGAELAELLEQACRGLAATLDVDRVSVHQMDEVSGLLPMTAAYGWRRDLVRSVRLALTPERRASLLRLAAAPEVLDDVSGREPDGPFLAAAGVASMLTVLIGGQGRAYGTLHAATVAPRSFNEQEVAFVESIANILWSAVQRSEAEETHRSAELLDPTTGLASRGLMHERLQGAIERARADGSGLAVLLVDVDEFKVINDAVGRRGGDDLLRALAPRLEHVARRGDTVARLGGDEFGLVCEGVLSEAHALDIAERVATAIGEPIELDGRRHIVRASIGVVVESGDASAEPMLRDAAAALHAAKGRGGGCVELFSPDIRQRAIARFNTEADLSRALEREQMRLHFQPFFSIPDRRLLGMEALVRWEHPRRGLVPPLDFIPLAEQTGLIVELGAWVLARATRTLADICRLGNTNGPLIVSVNVSARQLASPGARSALLQGIERALDDAGLPADALALEITESTLMDADQLPVLGKLKELGVQTMLDDFGTGHSSLGRLSEVPLDVVKIDRRFVNGLGEDQNREPIVAAIVAMADALGLRVIAEGVETERQWQSLKDIGCTAAQGFGLARPMPADELASLFDGQSQAA
jgi:diguanylate cyclase (GGDEF)-like protein